jgi:hypothetical protein
MRAQKKNVLAEAQPKDMTATSQTCNVGTLERSTQRSVLEKSDKLMDKRRKSLRDAHDEQNNLTRMHHRKTEACTCSILHARNHSGKHVRAHAIQGCMPVYAFIHKYRQIQHSHTCACHVRIMLHARFFVNDSPCAICMHTHATIVDDDMAITHA